MYLCPNPLLIIDILYIHTYIYIFFNFRVGSLSSYLLFWLYLWGVCQCNWPHWKHGFWVYHFPTFLINFAWNFTLAFPIFLSYSATRHVFLLLLLIIKILVTLILFPASSCIGICWVMLQEQIIPQSHWFTTHEAGFFFTWHVLCMLAAALISVFILGCKLKKEPPMWDMLGWARREGAVAEACRAHKALLGQDRFYSITFWWPSNGKSGGRGIQSPSQRLQQMMGKKKTSTTKLGQCPRVWEVIFLLSFFK